MPEVTLQVRSTGGAHLAQGNEMKFHGPHPQDKSYMLTPTGNPLAHEWQAGPFKAIPFSSSTQFKNFFLVKAVAVKGPSHPQSRDHTFLMRIDAFEDDGKTPKDVWISTPDHEGTSQGQRHGGDVHFLR